MNKKIEQTFASKELNVRPTEEMLSASLAIRKTTMKA